MKSATNSEERHEVPMEMKQDSHSENLKRHDTTAESAEHHQSNSDKKKYAIITDEQRRLLLVGVLTQGRQIKEVCQEVGVNLSTAQGIIKTFLSEGRIGKKKSRSRWNPFIGQIPNIGEALNSLENQAIIKPDSNIHLQAPVLQQPQITYLPPPHILSTPVLTPAPKSIPLNQTYFNVNPQPKYTTHQLSIPATGFTGQFALNSYPQLTAVPNITLPIATTSPYVNISSRTLVNAAATPGIPYYIPATGAQFGNSSSQVLLSMMLNRPGSVGNSLLFK